MFILVWLELLLLALHVHAAKNETTHASTNSTSLASHLHSKPSATHSAKGPITTDESCGGPKGTMCFVDGINPCCSSSGFCGNTDQYCGADCNPKYGLCHKPNMTLGNPACSWSGIGDSPRCDGQCGANFGGAVCNAELGPNALVSYGVYNYGPCCSSAGFCGGTSLHCGKGCQSGCNKKQAAFSSSTTGAATKTVTKPALAAGSTSTGAAAQVTFHFDAWAAGLAMAPLGAALAYL
ncbi:hypothetical protein NA57DRAFT_72589 [Rhizodiscina lignyota]|uniref:Chitin-binding type-1 domain-containing protein n=1 Tax=Rhizodiscina lignyota TaxID=1504668 RepID=A0A9P4IQ20_9PEZI|nr:hypothetical protein NA57DRAFT_72589 [Rhizodiscina lignyota]